MAEYPPAFNPSQRQSGNKVWLWLLLAVGGLCVLCVIGSFFGVKSLINKSMDMVSCSADGTLASKAVLAYALDHEGQFPPAATWQDDIRPYYERLYQKMQAEEEMEGLNWMGFELTQPGEPLECELAGSVKTGFAYNSTLAGKKTTDITEPHLTIMIWETTTPAYNANGDPSTRPVDDPDLKLFGDDRGWLDFLVTGDVDTRLWHEAGSLDIPFRTRPEDGLPTERTPGTSATPESN
jgi:hypothetical protein